MFLSEVKKRGISYWRLCETKREADGRKETKVLLYLGRGLIDQTLLLQMWNVMGQPMIPVYKGEAHWLIYSLNNFFKEVLHPPTPLTRDQLARVAQGLLILVANSGNWPFVFERWTGRYFKLPEGIKRGSEKLVG